MPAISAMRTINSTLNEMGPGLVGVFPGATSGIGKATCAEFVRNTQAPTVYIIRRNGTEALNLVKELEALNSKANVHFVQSDLTLLCNVDGACREIKEKEPKINLLFMTAGFLSMDGRDETSEGLDKMFTLQYYARMRFVVNLLPELGQASQNHQLSRVVSVLGAGREGNIFENDLLLKEHYSLANCSRQAICMTSLAFNRLAAMHPDISFVHISPGVVRGTNIMNRMGTVVSAINRVMGVAREAAHCVA